MNLLNERHRKEENEAFNKETCFPAKWDGTPLNIYFLINPTPSFLSTTIFILVNEILYLPLCALYVACLSFKDEPWFHLVGAVFSSRSDYVYTWLLYEWRVCRFSKTTILSAVRIFCNSVQNIFISQHQFCLLYLTCVWKLDALHFWVFNPTTKYIIWDKLAEKSKQTCVIWRCKISKFRGGLVLMRNMF
jgi:hypothetical protein